MKEKYKCPLCSENKAYRSKAYPNMVVCKCQGLKEVGEIVDGSFLPSIPLDSLETKPRNYLTSVNNFFIRKLKTIDDIKECGREFNNALQSDAYLRNLLPVNYIYIAEYDKDMTHPKSILFAVKKSILESHNYVLHNNVQPPMMIKRIIRDHLIEKKILRR